MPKGKITFIVEGDLEKEFLDKHCGKKLVIRKIPCNGENVAVDTLAAMIKAISATLRNPTQIFVVLDRESRPIPSHVLEQQLLAKLTAAGIVATLYVHIADRMIENWIIADPNALASEELEVDLSQGTEGTRGKGMLKHAFKKLGSTYSERVDGVRLLGKCRASIVAGNSQSFSRLYQALKGAAVPCGWIES